MSGNSQTPDTSSRPIDPPYAFGALQSSQPQSTTAYRSIYQQSRPVLPALVTQPPSVAERITHDLRVETNSIRDRLINEVQAQARQQNSLNKDLLQKRIDDRKRLYAGLGSEIDSKTPIPANEAAEIRETFTSPGLLLHQQESLLTENRFMPTRVLQAEHSRQFKEGFRKWFEKERDKEERRERVSGNPNDMLRTNNLNGVLPNGNAPSSSSQAAKATGTREGDSAGNQLTDPHESDRLNKPRITYQQIDSTDRDTVLYPFPNCYEIALSRRFTNVKRIKMVSSEIPNTDQIIRTDPTNVLLSPTKMAFQGGQLLNDANNNFYWIDEADGIEPGNYNNIIYDAVLTPGNYVIDACACNEVTMAQQIEAEVAAINRYIDGTPHDFQVNIDSRTNLVTVLSIETTLLGVNPIHTTDGTNEFTVTQLSQPFAVGDSVTLSGATNVGGIAASAINGTQQIIATTANSYTIRITSVASQTVDGGGANVTAGQNKPFMLLASNVDTPFTYILGFPQQDSAQQIATPITFIDCGPPNLAVNPTLPTKCGMVNVRITAANHGLSVGQQILISGTNTVPSINGVQTVTGVISNDIFEIGRKVYVVNNQTVTQNTILGSVCQSLDTSLTNITGLTLGQQGYIKTKFPHDLTTQVTQNVVWLGNLIGGLTETLQNLNGIQVADQIFTPNEFDIVGGVVYTGHTGNAFAVKTSSSALNSIVNITPANNGRFTPASAATIYTGSQVPHYVLFRNTNTTPNINADVVTDVDTTEICSAAILKKRDNPFWQSWTATAISNLVSIYLKVGSGLSGDQGQLSIYEGTGTLGPLLAQSLSATLENDICVGAYFCVGSVPVVKGGVYTFSVNMITRLQQSCAVCIGTAGYYTGGVSDLGGAVSYEFITYSSPDVKVVDYYSQTSGRFDLTTEILSVQSQASNQEYLRSLDPHIRCIQNALVASNGIWTFATPHGLAAGDNFLARLVSSPYTTTVPIIDPNIVGLQTVHTVIDAYSFDTSAVITSVSPAFADSTLYQQIEIASTTNTSPTSIVNIYPQSSGYLCADLATCRVNPTLTLCAGDMVIVRGGSQTTEPQNYTSLIEIDIATSAIIGNVYGCYTIGQIYSGTSRVCNDIFDFAVPGEHIALGPLGTNLGEFIRMVTDGGIPGQNGIFNAALVLSQTNSLIVAETAEPNFLPASSTIYMSTGTATCQSVGDVWHKPFLAAANNQLGYVTPDATVPNRFSIYSPTVTGNVVGQAQIYYHLVAGSEFQPIADFYANSYNGMLEVPNYGLSANANIFIGGVSVTPPVVGGCNSIIPIDGNFFTLQSFVTPAAVDPMPFRVGPTFPPTLMTTDLGFNVGIDVPLFITDGVGTITQKIAQSLTAFVTQQTSAGVLDPNQSPPGVALPMFSYSYLTYISPSGVTGNIVQIVNNPIPFTDVQNAYDVDTDFLFFSTADLVNGSQQTDVIVQTDAADLNINPTTNIPYESGQPARYFVMYAGGWRLGHVGKAYYKMYVYFTVQTSLIEGNVTGVYAGQYVSTETCTALQPVNITASDSGVIIAPNDFQGGECLYFLNDVNLNENTTNPIADNFFTVSTDGLSSTQFGLNVPITTVGPITGNNVQACQTDVYSTPGQYSLTATASQYQVVLSGAGGGNGIDYTHGAATPGLGGYGGMVAGVVDVVYGQPFYIFVGGAGENGKFTSQSFGGYNGGGDSGFGIAAFGGLGAGAGGGATDIRVGGVLDNVGFASQAGTTVTGVDTNWQAQFVGATIEYADGNKAVILSVNVVGQTMIVNATYTETNSTYSIYFIGTELQARVAVAAGGGGGTAAYATQFLGSVAGVDGGDGGGTIGNNGLGSVGYYGDGGTQIAGGASGGFAGALGLGGGPVNGAGVPVITPLTNLQFIGGGAGYYGGGSGISALVNGTNSLDALLGAGGGGSSFIAAGGTSLTGGGSASNVDGFAILRPLAIASFTTSTPANSANGESTVFTVPANATSITIVCAGAPGGNAATGPGVGGTGGQTSATFFVGGDSAIQPETILNILVGGQGAPGNGFGEALGGMNGGGSGSTGGGGGGGSSSVRIYTGQAQTTSNENLILIVAGGGGGAGTSGTTTNDNGGIGGGLVGGDAQGVVGSGGTQTMGGDGGTTGTFLFGANATGTGLGGGGGGIYGGGSGIVGANAFSGVGGGGGAAYVTPDYSTVDVTSIVYDAGGGSPVGTDGTITITWTTASTVSLPMGHFIQTPCANACDACGSQFIGLSLIEQKTNGLFTSQNATGFPLGNLAIAGDSTCIFLTNLDYGSFVTPQVQDVIAHAVPFPTPAPAYSTTQFETNIVITADDLQLGGFPLFGDNVDPVSTSDLRYPGIDGLGWILATDCLKNPIVAISPDSNGTFSPVIPGLAVGDTIYIDSTQPTTPSLTGAHIVSYVDTGNAIPQFFELADVMLTNTGGPIETGNIYAFRAPALVGNASPCFPIGNITSDTCPTLLQVTNNGYTVGSLVNLFITGTDTIPSINSVQGNTIERNIIVGAKVLPNDLIQLPLTDSSGHTLCNLQVLNETSLIITPGGQFSTQFLSTNAGRAIFQPDVANNLTVVYTPYRCNLETIISLSIVQSVPHPSGSSTIITSTALPANWASGTTVTISGQVLGNPYLTGSYKIFNLGASSFDIISGATAISTGGTGGFVTGPAPPSISGHGLVTGNLVQFMSSSPVCQSITGTIKPNIMGKTFTVTVTDASHFTIPIVITDVQGEAMWVNNLINAFIPAHGFAEGDIFFIYNCGNVGGLLGSQINTIHGQKIMNIPTNEEIATRKIAHVVDANNIQFLPNYGAFPTSRALGGGFVVCISAKNHDLAEVAMGYKNYGFAALQTNQNCTGLVNNFLNFSNLEYILMTSTRLSIDDSNPVINTGSVDNIFAKIQLSEKPGKVMYNTYIGGERLFYEPIARIDSIDIQFYRPDNVLFDFMGRNHAFTLEIEEYQDRMRTANVSSRRGLNDPGSIGQIGLVESLISRENPQQNLAGSTSVAAVAAATGLAGATGQ